MTFKILQRPSWSKTFIPEPDEVRYVAPTDAKRTAPFRALLLCTISFIALALQLCLLLTSLHTSWIIYPSIAWSLLGLYALLLRPRRFSLMPLFLTGGLFASDCMLLVQSWRNAFDLQQRLAVGTVALALLALLIVINMPMREPGWSRFGISKPFSEPSDKFRSPEDNLTFWQWMTVSWVSPLLRVGKKRKLDEEDVWLLPYEFQHAFLHNAFNRLKGTVLRRLLVANWIDLVILLLLEVLEVVSKYSEPILLQQLLRAMQRLQYEKRPALMYALLMMLVRVVKAQSEVFSLWYGRRCYERSRGELITMLYQKTLNRKVVAQPKEDNQDNADISNENLGLERVHTTRSTDETTPLLQKHEERPSWIRRFKAQFHNVWMSFRVGFKGVDPKRQEPAAMGKIMNLMRYDSYEVCQRFWEFQDLLERPLGLLVSVALIWHLLGWPALIGIAVILIAQVLNYLLALVEVRFEKVRRAATDQRLQQTSQYIESIRHLRWYGWQSHWLKNVFKARQRELNIRLVSYIWTMIMIFNNVFNGGFIVVAAFWAYTVLAKRELSIEVVFPALSIFEMIRANMGRIPELVQTLLNANVALKRIQSFMDEPEKENQAAAGGEISEHRVELRNAYFAWPGLSQNVLHDINVSFGPGLTVVVGEVASGKTALLEAILGELDMQGGEIVKSPSPMAYCAQTPWLQSMTIRDNILFNSVLEPERYKKVLEVCALLPDLASFEQGDLSPIGENGIGLSGGQKARVALARAIYSHATILLLDDPLSSLDQQTSELIVAECLQGELVKGRTVILVTHRTDLCEPIADHVVMMTDGKAQSKLRSGLSSSKGQANGKAKGINDLPEPYSADSKLIEAAMPEKFEEEEHRAHGDIKARVYWEYIKAGNLVCWIIVIFLTVLSRWIQVATNWFLKEFSEAYGQSNELLATSKDDDRLFAAFTTQSSILQKIFDRFPSPLENVSPWLIGLLVLTTSQALVLSTDQGAATVTRYLSGKNLFHAVMHKVTNTTFRYYDVTPIGRLMNRLTSDIGQVDGGIGQDLMNLSWYSMTWLVSITVIASTTPLFLAIAVVLSICYVLIFFHFLPTSQSLRRLETVSLSPLMTNFGALLTGLTTVRAFRAEDRFQAKLIKVVDTFQGMDHFYWSVQNWLTYRLEIMSAFSALVLTVVAIYTNLSAGLTAFVLISAQNFVIVTHGLCRVYGKLQVNFVSVERVVELLDLEQEPTNPVPPPAWWPSFGGNIVFENVTIRYAPHLDPALSDISFEVQGGTNTAIVGRTGSGKSTLAAALLATVPVDKGRILIDGIDLAQVDRQALRTRVTFLAQEPVLFEGSLRHNLDPTREHTDAECENVVARVASKFNWTLAMPIEAGGKNLSQGQRQLVGLARAILRRSSIIIMDEATASIDVETAWEIQRVLREELRGSTVLTIAHRTAAVRDADNAIVLANGRLSSFGPTNEEVQNILEDESA